MLKHITIIAIVMVLGCAGRQAVKPTRAVKLRPVSIAPAAVDAPSPNDAVRHDDSPPLVEHDAVSTTGGALFAQDQASDLSRAQAEMLSASNAIVPRQASPELMAAAQGHAEYLARTGRLEHSGANGTPQGRAQAHGFNGTVEEVAAGDFSTAQNAINGWMHSPAHRQAMVGGSTLCGFGCASGPAGKRWVGLFGRKSGDVENMGKSHVYVVSSFPVRRLSATSCRSGQVRPAPMQYQRSGPIRRWRNR